MLRILSLLLLLGALACPNLLAVESTTKQRHPLGTAKPLAESLKTFATLGGASLEVVASEPQIADPVAFDWGSGGELWVAEMGDYPNGSRWHGPGDPKGDPGGRIKLLFDRDDDGRYETAHCFLEGLSIPTSVKAYGKGVLICVAPQILYAEDTNGDHRADKQQVLYEGLRAGNQQHRANGLRWGLDHWIHLANGDSGGKLHSLQTGESFDISGRDFRIYPRTGAMELTSGTSQYGRSRDNQGNWFGGSNSEPAWHYVLDEKFQSRNRFVRSVSPRNVISATPGAAPVFPTSQTLERFNDFDRADRFTSACSTEVSRDDAASQAFVYVCEPVHNLVHRAELTQDGATFRSQRAPGEEQAEFLTSTDNWFRPVMVRFGPDDALWIADMYRQVIEHPEWIPMDWQTRIDHLGGNDRGRIYRVVENTNKATQDSPWKQVRNLPLPTLVASLDHANGVFRDMVQQELVERHDVAAIPLLKELYSSPKWRAARIPIVYLLRELNGLDESFVHRALDDNCFSTHLLQAALSIFQESPALRKRLDSWVQTSDLTDTEALRIGYLLGEFEDAGDTLATLLTRYHQDVWVAKALMSSVSEATVLPVLQATWEVIQGESFAESLVFRDLISIAVGTDHAEALQFIVSRSSQLPDLDRVVVVSLMLAEVDRRGKQVHDVFTEEQRAAIRKTAEVAVTALANNGSSVEWRIRCLSLLGYDGEPQPGDLAVLEGLLEPSIPPELQRATIRRIRQCLPQASANVFQRWDQFSPGVRDYAVRQALSDKGWTKNLLDALQREEIQPREIGLHLQARLREHRSPETRRRAAELLEPIPSDRERLVETYANHQSASLSILKGKALFQQQCNSCHQLEGQGRAVGPDLSALSDKSRPAMIAAILDPNRAVEDKYLNYAIVLNSGESLQGLLAQETNHSVTLATVEGDRQEIPRDRIEVMRCSGQSLMPEGLERVLDFDAMNHLVHYLQSVRSQPKRFPGNTPQVAPVRDDGSLRMFAMHAEVYGPSLAFEPKYRNLGFWSSESDYAVWNIHPERAGRYEFILDYACPDATAGNRFQLRVNGRKLSEVVEPTGSWDRYRSKRIGTLWLPKEPVQVSVSSEGPINGYLFDLRTIVLWPED